MLKIGNSSNSRTIDVSTTQSLACRGPEPVDETVRKKILLFWAGLLYKQTQKRDGKQRNIPNGSGLEMLDSWTPRIQYQIVVRLFTESVLCV